MVYSSLIPALFLAILSSSVSASGNPGAYERLAAEAGPAGVEVPEAVPLPYRGGGSGDAGRPGSFAEAAGRSFRRLPNHITIYAIPSPYPMDWSTLGSLAVSFARNQAAVKLLGQTNAIGHVAFEIGCTLPDGRRDVIVTGQVPSDGMGGFSDQVMAGAGYSAFFGHVPGRLQTRAELEKQMDSLSNQEDEVAFLTLKLSRESCLEAQRYIRAYDAEDVDTRYGLGVRPLYREGGGCANVGVSAVQVAGPGDFASLSRSWSRTFYIPEKLLGGPQDPVGAADVASHLRYDWTRKPAGTYRTLFFYDPDLIYKWIRAPKPGQPAWDNSPPRYERYSVNSAAGLTVDYSSDSRPTAWWLND
ncbi:MAG: hypothetical protein AB1734_00075 [Elusimicrobiota bacterium]